MNKYKKIIIFYPAYENGGATKILLNLTNFFLKKNIEINILSLNAKYKDFQNTKNLKIISVEKNYRKFLYKNRFVYNFFSILTFIKLLKKNNNTESVIFSMQSHLISTIIGKLFNYKVFIRNSEDPFGATRYADNKIIGVLVFLSKYISFNLADKIVTNASKSFISIKFFLLNKSKIKLILNPYIDSQKSYPKKKSKKKLQLIAIGRFAKQKNFEFLIEVFYQISNQLKDYKLLIIGSGSDEMRIKNKIKDLNMKNYIQIKKWSKNLSNDFNASKIFILPSLYEGCPNILVDAIMHKIPCISSNCSGASDILKNNKAGLIFPINNKKILINHIFKIIHNHAFYKKSAEAFSKSENRFFIKKQSEKYLKFFKI